jgi:hypothetical protein
MELMKNKYLLFENIEFLDKKIKNTTTLNLLPDIPDKYFGNDYSLQIKVIDDTLLEALSFSLYETTDYWDILMILNNMRSMNELPVNYDMVLNRADRKLQEWKEKGRLLPGSFTDEAINEKYAIILEEEITLNEKYRYIKYINQDDLSELTAELDKIAADVKINKNLII